MCFIYVNTRLKELKILYNLNISMILLKVHLSVTSG